MINVNLSYLIFYVKDVAATADFYEKAFGLKRRVVDPGGGYIEMDSGMVKLAFVSEELAKEHNPSGFKPNRLERDPPGMELVLVTDKLEAMFEQAINAGAKEVKGPEKKPWGQSVAYIRDPNGIIVELAGATQTVINH